MHRAGAVLRALLGRTLYVIVLGAVSAYVLLVFLRPSGRHIGINQYERALFLEMVAGTADRPFVSRMLLPVVVRISSALAPEVTHAFFRNLVEQSGDLRFLFRVFGWERQAALQYVIATLLMLVAFMGFGHTGAKLTLLTCGIRDRRRLYSTLFAVTLLALLIPFFKYASYIYDPPQLLLFTMALYFLANAQLRAFVTIFVLCCLNKETALLLIPIFALGYRQQMPRRRYFGMLAGLSAVFGATRLLTTLAFRPNAGSLVELHVTDHNLPWFLGEMTATNVIVFMSLLVLLLYRLKEKDRFLRIAFACTLPSLVILTLFLGYIDEWRDYYEAYPVGFAMIVDSLRRLGHGAILRVQPPAPGT